MKVARLRDEKSNTGRKKGDPVKGGGSKEQVITDHQAVIGIIPKVIVALQALLHRCLAHLAGKAGSEALSC